MQWEIIMGKMRGDVLGKIGSFTRASQEEEGGI
jgi:hypothetical protein